MPAKKKTNLFDNIRKKRARIKAEAHEWVCSNDQEHYGECQFFITEEIVDAQC